jgi:hypothetical protein
MDAKRLKELASEVVAEEARGAVVREKVEEKMRKKTKGKKMKAGKKPSMKGAKSLPAWLAAKIKK